MAPTQKLELTSVGKDDRPKLEPRILLEDPEKSYHAPHRVTDHDLFDNRLIFGNDLLTPSAGLHANSSRTNLTTQRPNGGTRNGQSIA